MVYNGGSSASSLFVAIDVAVKAAVQSGAPRRTVAATAAAVTQVVIAQLHGDADRTSGRADAAPSVSQRRRMKRKRAAERKKLASSSSVPQPLASVDGTAGEHEVVREDHVAAPAPVPLSTAAQPPEQLPTEPADVVLSDNAGTESSYRTLRRQESESNAGSSVYQELTRVAQPYAKASADKGRGKACQNRRGGRASR